MAVDDWSSAVLEGFGSDTWRHVACHVARMRTCEHGVGGITQFGNFSRGSCSGRKKDEVLIRRNIDALWRVLWA